MPNRVQLPMIAEVQYPWGCERGTYPINVGDKGYISVKLDADLLRTYQCVSMVSVTCVELRRYNIRQGFVRSMLILRAD